MSAPFDDAFAGCLRGRSSDFHEWLKRIVKMNWIFFILLCRNGKVNARLFV